MYIQYTIHTRELIDRRYQINRIRSSGVYIFTTKEPPIVHRDIIISRVEVLRDKMEILGSIHSYTVDVSRS